MIDDESIPNSYIAKVEGHRNQSQEVNELVTAFAKASAEMDGAYKDLNNAFLKYNYCSLGQMIDTTRPVLSKYGLSVFQPIIDMGDYHILHTKLFHSSGQWIGSTIRIKPEKDGNQAFGSSITYMSRYAYKSLLGISFKDETDDDSERTANRDAPEHIPENTYIKPAELITAEQLDDLECELEYYDDIKDMLLKALDITSLDKMQKSIYAESIDMVRLKKEERNH